MLQEKLQRENGIYVEPWRMREGFRRKEQREQRGVWKGCVVSGTQCTGSPWRWS